MTEFVDRAGLSVARELAEFVEARALPGTGVEAAGFWAGFAGLVADFTPRNRALLGKRAELQQAINQWHKDHLGQPHDIAAYKAFLEEIGYLVPEGEDFQIDTSGIDPEFASIAGPQLVVPVTNARFVLNAANARWGSLYDGFYGTDAMGPPPGSGPFDAGQGARVVARAAVFLDETFPLEGTSHGRAQSYAVVDGALQVDGFALKQPEKFAGFRGDADAPTAVLLKNNGLHVIGL